MTKEIDRTIGDTAFGTSLKDLEDGDLSRGYFDATPKGDYERSLGDKPEPFDYPEMEKPNGDGFLKRPKYKSDVERN